MFCCWLERKTALQTRLIEREKDKKERKDNKYDDTEWTEGKQRYAQKYGTQNFETPKYDVQKQSKYEQKPIYEQRYNNNAVNVAPRRQYEVYQHRAVQY